MLITAAKTAHYRKLADDLDAALARGDEIGLDLLRGMLPELGEAIEEINDALREIDALLFEGLRDEAIGLHDADLPAIALRLHLPDKSAWPMVSLTLDSEGMKPPPAIDFATLSALNSAFVEVDALRKPLDELRRLALERAPMARRLSLLRRLRAHDASKPVWADQLTTHEEVRVLELDAAVKKALAARDADGLASLHDEMTAAEWSVPISSRLRNATEGGQAWAGLRSTVRELESIAAQITTDHGAVHADDDRYDDRVERLRILRQRWLAGETQARDLLFAMPQHTALMPLTREEDFGPRLDTLQRQVAPALDWLAAIERREAVMAQFRQVCGELQLLTQQLPDSKAEAQWLGRVEALDAELHRLCRQHAALHVPESLPVEIAQAVTEVRARGARRGKRQLVAAAAALACCVALLAVAASFISDWRDRASALAHLQELQPAVKQGEYIARTEQLESYAKRHGDNAAFAAALDEFDEFASLERTRRDTFDELLADHDGRLKGAADALALRAEAVEARLAGWPAVVFEAADKVRAARLKGGFPKRRFIDEENTPPRSTGEADVPPAARQRFVDEETRLAEHADKQSRLERSYSAAAIDEFQRQLRLIEEATPEADAPNAADTAKTLLRRLNALLEEGRKPRSGEYAPTKRRLLFSTLDAATPLQARLEKMALSR